MAPKDGPGTATHHGEVGTEFGADPEGSAKDNVNATEAELRAWMTLGTDALAMFEQLITLLRLELTLAIADGKRLILVGLAMIPLVLLAWIGFSVLVAWVVYAITASVAVGLSGFLLLQIGVLGILVLAARRFSRSLGFPASRRQLNAILQGADARSRRRPSPRSAARRQGRCL